MQLRNVLILGTLILLLGYAVGRYAQPADVKERVVIKEVESTKKNVVIVEKEVIKKDGTIVKEKITTDKTTIDKSLVSDKSKETSSRNKWLVAVGATTDFKSTTPNYNVSLHRRFFGPVLLGGSYSTSGELGVSVGLEF